MQNTPKNKMIEGSSNKADASPAEEYFFSGGGEYEPITVLATSREDVEAKWLAVRVKVGIIKSNDEK